jgi:hypothetical protein
MVDDTFFHETTASRTNSVGSQIMYLRAKRSGYIVNMTVCKCQVLATWFVSFSALRAQTRYLMPSSGHTILIFGNVRIVTLSDQYCVRHQSLVSYLT